MHVASTWFYHEIDFFLRLGINFFYSTTCAAFLIINFILSSSSRFLSSYSNGAQPKGETTPSDRQNWDENWGGGNQPENKENQDKLGQKWGEACSNEGVNMTKVSPPLMKQAYPFALTKPICNLFILLMLWCTCSTTSAVFVELLNHLYS